MSRRPKPRKYMFAKLEYRAMDTCRSEGRVIEQIHKLLNELDVAYDERMLPTDALSGKAALQFVVHWQENGDQYDAKIQKISMEQKGLANNLAAIHLWLEGRCLNIRRGNCEKWRGLPEEQLAICEAVLADQMEYCGYERSDAGAFPISRARVLHMRLNDVRKRVPQRIRRFWKRRTSGMIIQEVRREPLPKSKETSPACIS